MIPGFTLKQCYEFDIVVSITQRQNSACRHVAVLGHSILTPYQPVLTALCCVLCKKAFIRSDFNIQSSALETSLLTVTRLMSLILLFISSYS